MYKVNTHAEEEEEVEELGEEEEVDENEEDCLGSDNNLVNNSQVSLISCHHILPNMYDFLSFKKRTYYYGGFFVYIFNFLECVMLLFGEWKKVCKVTPKGVILSISRLCFWRPGWVALVVFWNLL